MLRFRVLVCRSLVAGLSLFPGLASALSIGLGPIGGLNLGNASIKVPAGTSVKTGTRAGLALGARAELGVRNTFSVLLEPTFLQRGAVEDYEGFNTTGRTRTRLDYLEVPALAKLKIGDMHAHGYVFAGPSLGIFLTGEKVSGGETRNAKDIRTLNVSGEVGGGGSYQLGPFLYLNLDARYSLGTTNANDAANRGDYKWYSRDIRVMGCVLSHLTL
jgi:hypothetical protein